MFANSNSPKKREEDKKKIPTNCRQPARQVGTETTPRHKRTLAHSLTYGMEAKQMRRDYTVGEEPVKTSDLVSSSSLRVCVAVCGC